MTSREQWKDLLSGKRAERDSFKKRATYQRKEWLRARKERRWIDALYCKNREIEYRNAANQIQSFIDQNKFKAYVFSA
jgi:hypothetical protein